MVDIISSVSGYVNVSSLFGGIFRESLLKILKKKNWYRAILICQDMLSVLNLWKSLISLCWYTLYLSLYLKEQTPSRDEVMNNVCLQVTGGGGYTKENVARCWAVETGVLLDTVLPNGNFFSSIFFLFF